MLSLLDKKSFEKITVQNILDEALINRTTFYKYYCDKYSVVEKFCEKFVSEFKVCVKKRFDIKEKDNILHQIDTLYSSLYKDKDLFLKLISIKTETIHLEDDITEVLISEFTDHYYNIIKNTEKLQFLSAIYSSVVVSSLKWYLSREKNDDIKLINTFIPNLQKLIDSIN